MQIIPIIMDLENMNCCGIREASGLQDTPIKNCIYAVARLRFGYEQEQFGFVIFSEEASYRKGSKLKAYIKKHKLGTVVQSPIEVNPNTSNRLRVYIYTIHQDNLQKWWLKNGDDVDMEDCDDDDSNMWDD